MCEPSDTQWPHVGLCAVGLAKGGREAGRRLRIPVRTAESGPPAGSSVPIRPVPAGKNMCVQTAPCLQEGKTTLTPDYKLNNICGPL